jgi:hypothetical protein
MIPPNDDPPQTNFLANQENKNVRALNRFGGGMVGMVGAVE